MLGLDFHVISIFCLYRTLYRIHTWELFVQNIRNMEYGKIFVHGKIKSGRRLVVAELYAGVQISNREVAVKQKFAKHDVKNEVSFSLCKYHIEIKKKKKCVCNTRYFSREILIHRDWRQEIPLYYWFAVSGGEIVSWRGVSCLQTFMN